MRRMAVVGLTERYHETLMMLKYVAGLTIVKYRSINKGVKRPKLADVPQCIKDYTHDNIFSLTIYSYYRFNQKT